MSLLSLASCGPKDPPAVAVGSVTLDKTSAELTEGETLSLKATVTPGDATNKTIAWTSSNDAVVTVSNGTVTAVKAGSATVKVTTQDGGRTATCSVTVRITAVSEEGGFSSSCDVKVVENSGADADVYAGLRSSIYLNGSNTSIFGPSEEEIWLSDGSFYYVSGRTEIYYIPAGENKEKPYPAGIAFRGITSLKFKDGKMYVLDGIYSSAPVLYCSNFEKKIPITTEEGLQRFNASEQDCMDFGPDGKIIVAGSYKNSFGEWWTSFWTVDPVAGTSVETKVWKNWSTPQVASTDMGDVYIAARQDNLGSYPWRVFKNKEDLGFQGLHAAALDAVGNDWYIAKPKPDENKVDVYKNGKLLYSVGLTKKPNFDSLRLKVASNGDTYLAISDEDKTEGGIYKNGSLLYPIVPGAYFDWILIDE